MEGCPIVARLVHICDNTHLDVHAFRQNSAYTRSCRWRRAEESVIHCIDPREEVHRGQIEIDVRDVRECEIVLL